MKVTDSMHSDRIDASPTRLYCDFNDRIEPAVYGLRVAGTREDLARQGHLLSPGLPVVLYDYDAISDGQPAWIIAEGIVESDPKLEFVARVDPESFRWILRRGDPHDDLRRLSTFRAESAYQLSGRGGVLVGSILQGELCAGMAAVAWDRDISQVLEIESVDFIDDLKWAKAA